MISLVTMFAISFWICWIASTAFTTFSFLPVMAIMSLSVEESGRSMRVSVSSLILLMLAPPLSRSSLVILLKCLAHLSTSSLGPRSFTMSLLLPRSGKLIWTAVNSLRIFSISPPFAPINCLWNLFSTIKSFSFSFSILSTIEANSALAFSTPALLPSILMTVAPLSVSGMLMVTSASDLILLMVEPPLPMMCLWYFASTLTSAKAVSFTSFATWSSRSSLAFSTSSGGPSTLKAMCTLGRSCEMRWMPAPFLPMIYLCSQVGQGSTRLTTLFAFSYTLVKARPSFSWGPRSVIVSLSSALDGISTKTPVSARISLMALPRGPITYRCCDFFTSTWIVEHFFSMSFQMTTMAAFTASTPSFSPVMESSSLCTDNGGILILTFACLAVQAAIVVIWKDMEKKCSTIQVEVKKSQHRYVIGPRGNAINEILVETGVFVEMPSNADE